MNPILIAKIAGIVIAVLAIFYTGERYERSSWLEKEVEQQQQVANKLQEANDKNKAIGDEFERYRATHEQFKATVRKDISNEIKTNSPLYSCLVPPNGVRLINSAITEANGSKQPGK